MRPRAQPNPLLEPEPLQQVERTYVRLGPRKLSYFSGCDYFRLASHPRILTAVQAGVRKFGLNVAASRLTTGNHVLYRRLEERLSEFFQVEAAVVVPTGYVAGMAVAQSLAGNFSHALLDDEAHPALKDAAGFLDCPILRFRSRDAASLAQTVGRCGSGARPLLFTEGMFAQDGSVAPLGDYLRALPQDGALVVDDAHGVGVLGAHGRGAIEHCGVRDPRVIQTITLSKALGVYGGAILGTKALRRQVMQRSRLFVGSTPLPLPLAHAALAAVDLVSRGRRLRARLHRNIEALRAALPGWPVTPGPILAAFPARPRAVEAVKAALLGAGIYPPFIRYPGAPKGGYFRFAISSEHQPAQLRNLSEVLRECRGDLTPAPNPLAGPSPMQ